MRSRRIGDPLQKQEESISALDRIERFSVEFRDAATSEFTSRTVFPEKLTRVFATRDDVTGVIVTVTGSVEPTDDAFLQGFVQDLSVGQPCLASAWDFDDESGDLIVEWVLCQDDPQSLRAFAQCVVHSLSVVSVSGVPWSNVVTLTPDGTIVTESGDVIETGVSLTDVKPRFGSEKENK